ncbi:hypothetical protein AB0G20_11830 [Streptomyces sp. NPDC024017]|uniref:hypothetical protein n=1 Tax=Streptomyces sp. NPDC024017 TaxID=3154326 RepID=UPI00340ABD02
MAADQLPAQVGEFATYLDGLLARLDPSGGWFAVFWQRDPEGMRACLDGREMPPWDVVEALLQDLAGQYGPAGAGPETERARTLHAAALAAYDTRPGGRDALGDRLDAMLREQKYAAERQAALARHLTSATTREQADALRLDLAWARDDHERAGARCAELRARLAHLDRRDQEAFPRAWSDGEAPRGAGAGSSPADDLYGPGTPLAATGAADREAGRRAPQHPEGRTVPGEAAAGVAPDGLPASAVTGAAGRYDTRYGAAVPEAGRRAPQHREGRTVPGQAAAGVAPDGHPAPALTGAAGRYGTRYDAAEPEAGRHAPQHPEGRTAADEAAPRVPDAFTAPAPSPASQPLTPKQRKRRRGSARFAGMADEEVTAATAVPPAVVPTLPAPAPTATRRTLRGARFAGAAEEAGAERRAPEAHVPGTEDRAEVGRTVEVLARLRSEGRSGEAHALLAEVVSWEPGRFPLLAERLHLAGLDADWQTLLWEAASLPAGRLVAAADALAAAGRAGDGQQMLRQGVARPPGEIGEAVLGLAAEGRHREVRVLLDAYVRVRTPEEAARSAEPDPQRLVPLLLEAARDVSEERRWDVVYALRVAGFPA